MGIDPSLNVLSCSHTQKLATSFGRRVRNVVRSNRYKQVFRTRLDPESKSAGRWDTVQDDREDRRRGSYLAAGVGSGIAGFRAGLGLIDDPVRSREDADSEIVSESNWNWYLNDFRTRLLPDAGIIIINTRWVEHDICGRILPEGYNGESGIITSRDGQEDWLVISIQALCEREDDILERKIGESYWPGYVRQELLERERIIQLPRAWAALYQQRPNPDEGDYYSREWFQWYDELPDNVRYYGASDYAVSDGEGDWTVHLVGAVTGPLMFESLYLVDMWRERKDSSVWIAALIKMILKYKPIEWAEEKGQIARGLGPMIQVEQDRARAWTVRRGFSVAGDKAQRAQTFRAMAAQKRVYLPRRADWSREFLDRLMRWQTTMIDDEHDACGLMGRMIYGMRGDKKVVKRSDVPEYGTYDYMLWVTDRDGQQKKSIYRGT